MTRISRRPFSLLLPVLATLSTLPVFVSGQGGGSVSQPDFEGIWNSATATPLERPRDLKDKPFFTPEEAAAWERRIARRNEEPPPEAVAKSAGTGTYNTFFREFGARTVRTRRTSIVIDPPDGRIPALTAEAAEIKRLRVVRVSTLLVATIACAGLTPESSLAALQTGCTESHLVVTCTFSFTAGSSAASMSAR